MFRSLRAGSGRFLLAVVSVVCLGWMLTNPVRAADAEGISWEDGTRPCWADAGARHGIDPWLLYAIAYVESRHNPYIISRPNSNGTRDLGLMQINDTWLPTLNAYGIPREALFNACASTYIGAWIMAKNFRRYGYSWQAIAAYNVGSLDTPRHIQLGYAYAQKVYAAYAILTAYRGYPPQPHGAVVLAQAR
jgi:soluble lytic murein transglycosylase-like protein